jgi:hypothetical protein
MAAFRGKRMVRPDGLRKGPLQQGGPSSHKEWTARLLSGLTACAAGNLLNVFALPQAVFPQNRCPANRLLGAGRRFTLH